MCTDEQWTRKRATETLMTSKFWLKTNQQTPTYDRKPWFTFWLTPLDVPREETNWFMQFPPYSAACQTHIPAKLK
jgi:hypothetical protein